MMHLATSSLRRFGAPRVQPTSAQGRQKRGVTARSQIVPHVGVGKEFRADAHLWSRAAAKFYFREDIAECQRASTRCIARNAMMTVAPPMEQAISSRQPG
jgi:hypothetical protein